MRSSFLIAALSGLGVYATPVAQNGRWQAEWESSHAKAASVTPTTLSTATRTASLLGNPSASPNPPANAKLVADLLTAPLTSDRLTILKDAVGNNTADFKFDFNPAANPTAPAPGLGGEVINANRKTFPVLTTLGVSFAALFFEPCGLNPPHIHPRATEVLTIATDSQVLAGFVLDNTFTMEINETLTQYQGMAFPQGSIHWQLNQGCEPAVGIAGFGDEDPGASSIANRFFGGPDKGINPDVAIAALGFPEQITSENFADFAAGIPAPFAKGVQECYQKCGIAY